MSKKKGTGERVKPAPYVSIKHKGTGIHARFTKYADRAVICKLTMTREISRCLWSDFDFRDEKETRALCHPGDAEKNQPADTFDEIVGMDIAYIRATKIYNKRLKRMKESVERYTKELADGLAAITELTEAIEVFEREYTKLRDAKLLVCETK